MDTPTPLELLIERDLWVTALPVGGPLHKISERGRGRVRHPVLADAAILVQRSDWHIRSLLRGAHPGSARLPRPTRLAAQFLDCGGFSNAYRSGIRHGGAFDLKQATWAYNNALADAKDPAVKSALEAEDIKAWFTPMPWRKGQSPVSAAPDYEDYLIEQWSHGIFDDFWKRLGIYAEGYYERYADVPIAHFSGWYDPYARTATENYLGLQRRKRASMRLILTGRNGFGASEFERA